MTTTKTRFPDFPNPDCNANEHAFALGYLEAAIRNLHDRLDGLRSCSGFCADLRQIPVDLANSLNERRLRG